MKILKSGTLNKKREKFFTCGFCDCEFIANDHHDLKSDRDGYYVVCPTCGKAISWTTGKTTGYNLASEIYDKIERIYYNNALRWDEKYAAIFSKGLASQFKNAIPGCFTWYDPDSSYEDDVTAFFNAATEYISNHYED